MAKISYRKIREFKIFNLKIFSYKTDYVEFSTEDDTKDDLFNIELDTENIRRK